MKADSKKLEAAAATRRNRSKAGEIWHRMKKNKGAMAGLVILIILALIALTVDFWLPEELINGQNLREKLQGPSMKHFFGTDELGRDLFWRVIYGTRYSLAIGFVAVLISAALAVVAGVTDQQAGDHHHASGRYFLSYSLHFAGNRHRVPAGQNHRQSDAGHRYCGGAAVYPRYPCFRADR